MKSGNFLSWLVAGAVSIAAVVAVEAAATAYNRRHDINMPFLFMRGQSEAGESFRVSAIDPHIGHAHDPSRSAAVTAPHVMLPGFTVHAAPGEPWPRPWIVTLGGSTTDPNIGNGSWPGELAHLMTSQGIAGTVINGGVAGYTTSQELLKMIRDVVELGPDIVISYSGINEQGKWAPMPTPMVHPRQRDFFNQVLSSTRAPAPVLPNTAHLLSSFGRSTERLRMPIVTGIETRKSPGAFWMRNVDMMRAVAATANIRYVSVIQPVIGIGASQAQPRHLAKLNPAYLAALEQSYAIALGRMTDNRDLVDFTGIFSGQDVFFDDARHVEPAGNKIVGHEMLKLLTARGWLPCGKAC